MSVYFIGVDLGTVHTKVCLRESIDLYPAPVVVDAMAEGLAKYLLPSVPPWWKLPRAPKVLLCGAGDIPPEVENQALWAAVSVLQNAIRAAMRQADATDADEKQFRLQLGLPTEQGVMVEEAKQRYHLVAEAAMLACADARLSFSFELFDERLASLAHLHLAKMELSNQPLLVLDGGGWTTHVSLLRWIVVGADPQVSIHGDHTKPHGVQAVVKAVAARLQVSDSDAVEILDAAMVSAYAKQRKKAEVLDGAASNSAVLMHYTRSRQVPEARGREELRAAVEALQAFASAPMLKDAWQRAWERGYEANRSPRYFTNYLLLLAGGAPRIGRRHADGLPDPIAASLSAWQERTSVRFKEAVYPELDQRFWTFSPVPPPEVVPYFFVAGGYSYPRSDWPKELQRSVIRMDRAEFRISACGCNGTSENCPSCSGTGLVRTTVAPPPAQRDLPRFTQARSFQPEQLCEICGEIVPDFGSLAHFNSHLCPAGCGQRIIDKRRHVMEQHGWKECSECRRVPSNLARHLRQEHRRSAGPQGSGPASAPSPDNLKATDKPPAPIGPPPVATKSPPSASRPARPPKSARRETLEWPPKVDTIMHPPDPAPAAKKKVAAGSLKHNPFMKLKDPNRG